MDVAQQQNINEPSEADRSTTLEKKKPMQSPKLLSSNKHMFVFHIF